jgi:plastocyanin
MKSVISILLVASLLALWGFKSKSNTAGTQCDPNKQKSDVVVATPSSPNDQIVVAKVNMTSDLKFDPYRVDIHSGQAVVWKNTSSVIHTVTADPNKAKNKDDVSLPEGAQAFDSGNIEPGQTYTHTFTFPGTYKYICVPHEEMGMMGEVIVTPANN